MAVRVSRRLSAAHSELKSDFADGWLGWKTWFQPQIVTLASAGQTTQILQLFRGNLQNCPKSGHIRSAVAAAKANGHVQSAKILFQLMAVMSRPAHMLSTTLLPAAAGERMHELLQTIHQSELSGEIDSNEAGKALIAAAKAGCVQTAQVILGHFAQSSAEDAATALVNAAQSGCCATVRLLLDVPLSPDSKADNKLCALHAACNKAHVAVARLLIEAGADVGMVEGPLKSSNCLHALLGGFRHADCREILELIPTDRLVELLHQPERSLRGYTPVMMAVIEGGAGQRHATGRPAQLPTILACGAELDLSCKTLNGEQNVFHVLCSCRQGDTALLDSLRALMAVPGAETAVAAADSRGRTPLHHASENNALSVETLRFLLSRVPKSQLQQQDSKGDTPLHLACGRHKPGKVLLLLEAGADPYIENDKGHDAAAAVLNGNECSDMASMCLIRLLQLHPVVLSSPTAAATMKAALVFGEPLAVCKLNELIADVDFPADKLLSSLMWRVAAQYPLSASDADTLLAAGVFISVLAQREQCVPRRCFDCISSHAEHQAPLLKWSSGNKSTLPPSISELRPDVLLRCLPSAMVSRLSVKDDSKRTVASHLLVVVRSLVRAHSRRIPAFLAEKSGGMKVQHRLIRANSDACWFAHRQLVLCRSFRRSTLK